MYCSGVTKKGEPCRNKISGDNTHCWRHRNAAEEKKEIIEIKDDVIEEKKESKKKIKRRKPKKSKPIVDENKPQPPIIAIEDTPVKKKSHRKRSCAKKCAAWSCANYAVKDSKNGKYCKDHNHQYRLDITECAICMEEVSIETDIPLQCGHLFHSKCLDDYFRSTCPCCRQKFTDEECENFYGERINAIKLTILDVFQTGENVTDLFAYYKAKLDRDILECVLVKIRRIISYFFKSKKFDLILLNTFLFQAQNGLNA